MKTYWQPSWRYIVWFTATCIANLSNRTSMCRKCQSFTIWNADSGLTWSSLHDTFRDKGCSMSSAVAPLDFVKGKAMQRTLVLFPFTGKSTSFHCGSFPPKRARVQSSSSHWKRHLMAQRLNCRPGWNYYSLLLTPSKTQQPTCSDLENLKLRCKKVKLCLINSYWERSDHIWSRKQTVIGNSYFLPPYYWN